MYAFNLVVENDHSKLILLKNGQEIEEIGWSEERDMGRRLFQAIDELLKKKRIEPTDIAEFRVVTDLPEHSTSRRIAETVEKVYNFGVGVHKRK